MSILLLVLGGATSSDLCKEGPIPTIGIGTKPGLKKLDFQTVSLPYGEDITLHCSAARNISIQLEDSQSLQRTTLNETTIQLKKPDVGHHVYICTDSSGCRSSLTVHIRPEISVTSPNTRETQDVYGKRISFVPRGEPFYVICSGSKADSLSVFEADKFHPLETRTVNNTAVQGEVQANYTTSQYYYCLSDYQRSDTINVIIDYYPDAVDFQCKTENRRLKCSWRTSSAANNFGLYFLRDNETAGTLLCTDNFRAASKGCSSNTPMSAGNLILQICNQVFCISELFLYNYGLIQKLNPPDGVKVSNVSSGSAIVAWSNSGSVSMFNCVFNVEYRLLDAAWEKANTSSVKCDLISCELLLTLPCPGSYYEVRVFMKSKNAVGDRFWSEPVSAFFFTESKPSGDVDPTCSSLAQESEPPLSREVGLYKIRNLIKLERKRNLELKIKTFSLKNKLDRIKELMELIAD